LEFDSNGNKTNEDDVNEILENKKSEPFPESNMEE
jgi:hypothetical protein